MPVQTSPPPSAPPQSTDAPDFCRRYVFVASRNQLYDRVTGQYITVEAAERRHAQEVGEKESFRQILLAGPRHVDKTDGVTFWPGQSELVHEDGAIRLNRWVRPTLEAMPGDPSPFLEHVAYIFDGDWPAVAHVLDFLAHLVQQPDQKIRSAIMLTGAQGTGKSILGVIAKTLVGLDNAETLSSADLASQFNAWVEAAQLVVVEEVARDERRFVAARLKGLITDDFVLLNAKGVSPYRVRNRANFILISNDRDAAVIDNDDRRFFVWHSEAQPKPAEYYQALQDWLAADGYSHVLHFLRHRDISAFNPHGAPPRTAARAELARDSRSELDTYLGAALEAGEVPFECDLVVVNHLHDHLRRTRHMRCSSKGIAAFLRSAGAVELGQKRIGQHKPRVWAIRDIAHWQAATEDEIAATYRMPGQAAAGAWQGRASPHRISNGCGQSPPLSEW